MTPERTWLRALSRGKMRLSSTQKIWPSTGGMKTVRAFFCTLFVTPGILSACGSGRESAQSKMTQLGLHDYPCITYQPQQIAQALQGMPEGFILESSFRIGQVDRVKNQLTGIPRPYLQRLFELHGKNGFEISEYKLPSYAMGSTQRARESLVPLRIDIQAAEGAIDFAVQHEVGHAVEGFIKKLHKGTEESFSKAYEKERSKPELRAYAQSDVGEYFAEAFANFYCSKEAQLFIADHLPQTYKVLKSSLLPASFDAPSPEPMPPTKLPSADTKRSTALQ